MLKTLLLALLLFAAACSGAEPPAPNVSEDAAVVSGDDALVSIDSGVVMTSDGALLFEDAAPAPDAVVDVDAGLPLDSGVVVNPDAEPAPDAMPTGRPYPAPSAWGTNHGPGGPNVTFMAGDLFQNCAYLDGGPDDTTDHHNLVLMYDGYLLMPWSPEFRRGGLTFFDVSNPCSPVLRGRGFSTEMRESHSIGFSHVGGSWAVVDGMTGIFSGGIQFWDVSDTSQPTAIGNFDVPGFRYPDAYARVTLSVFWQVPYVFVGGADNGIYVIDATDPRMPRLVTQFRFMPTLRVGQVQAIGNLLIATAAEGPRAVLLDISDPSDPQPIPGGDFLARDDSGTPRESYFSNSSNGYLYFARKSSGGGPMIYDIHNPSSPTKVGAFTSSGNGGYIFVKDNLAFQGESSFGAIYDLSNLANITEVGRFNLVGDLDTLTPIGNVAVVAVDDDAERDRGSAISPWRLDPDRQPPSVTWVYPADGTTGLPITSRIGVTFNEMVDVKSAWEGSVRLYETGTDPAVTRVDGYVSAQETIVNFWPLQPLRRGVQYTLEIPAGGILDFNGNAIATAFTAQFTTQP